MDTPGDDASAVDAAGYDPAELVRQAIAELEDDVELLRHLQAVGAEIVEIPVAWSHASGSSFSPLRDGMSAFRAVMQLQRVAGTP